ncbi:MAG: decarboxylating NADP(+)-dependent phosphogluconate dehydrogenase [Clostridiales bacterium]|nr:decarboxylating NADP(+)-dependent phosphogluconate dehydrogenase [Clostridiales bacterium]
MGKADIGVIGLAVMGENLVMNMESKGFTVAVFNRTVSRVREFVEGRAKGLNILGAGTLAEFVGLLKKPRKVLLMVKAGQPVDDFINLLLPHLETGDIIMDGGNSHYPDTARRVAYVESRGLKYIGTGVSGGEEGALMGPSIMPGGSPGAWEHVKPILQAIAAQVDGQPCCDWVGEGGAGHFVKMVHNGIEYGDMQLISEVYHMMREVLGMTPDEMAEVFADWNRGELESYLVEITADILRVKDEDGSPLIDNILDAAGQKGTGKWTAQNALEEGVPLTLITEAVFARALSSDKEGRVAASKVLSYQGNARAPERARLIDQLRQALYAAKIVSYTQGYMLMRAAAGTYQWNLNYGGIAMMWRGGCIIRSAFLGKIKEAFDKNPQLENLMLDAFFTNAVQQAQHAWRKVCATALLHGIPAPALTSGLAFFDGIRTACLSANMLQAQRDYFGAHTYERVDRPRGEWFHTNWTGKGGSTASSTYNA